MLFRIDKLMMIISVVGFGGFVAKMNAKVCQPTTVLNTLAR